jgi:tryptophan synthase alpha chain
MSRLSEAFARAKAEGRTALVCYAMGGDGDTVALLRAIDEAGADVIELGLPFSDPIADGPVLQAAATRALGSGATVRSVLKAASGLKLRAPMVAMGYVNPIESMGNAKFAQVLR